MLICNILFFVIILYLKYSDVYDVHLSSFYSNNNGLVFSSYVVHNNINLYHLLFSLSPSPKLAWRRETLKMLR